VPRWIQILIFVIVIGVLIFFAIGLRARGELQPSVGVAPDFKITSFDGQAYQLSQLKGKVVVINFWASWCPPCREEMPSIESLFKEMYGNDKFQIITILYKDPYQDGTSYMKQNGYTFPVYSDSNGIAAKNFGVTGVPETYVIDKNGILKKRVLGPAEWNAPEAKNFLNSLLNE